MDHWFVQQPMLDTIYFFHGWSAHEKKENIFSFFYGSRSSCQCFLNFILLLFLQSQPSLLKSLDTIVPKTYLQVVVHDCWGKALIEELDPLAENHTWDI